MNQHQSTGLLFNIVCGITNRSHCVTFVNATLSPILSYTPGLSLFLLLPLCVLLHTPLLLLSHALSALTSAVVLGFSPRIMSQATDGEGDQPTRTMQWSGVRCRRHSHPPTMMDDKMDCVFSESFVMLYVRVHLSAPFVEPQDAASMFTFFSVCTSVCAHLHYISYSFLNFKTQ